MQVPCCIVRSLSRPTSVTASKEDAAPTPPPIQWDIQEDGSPLQGEGKRGSLVTLPLRHLVGSCEKQEPCPAQGSYALVPCCIGGGRKGGACTRTHTCAFQGSLQPGEHDRLASVPHCTWTWLWTWRQLPCSAGGLCAPNASPAGNLWRKQLNTPPTPHPHTHTDGRIVPLQASLCLVSCLGFQQGFQWTLSAGCLSPPTPQQTIGRARRAAQP